MIETQAIAPGEALSVTRAAKLLGTTTWKARTALRKLEEKGLLSKAERGRGGSRRVTVDLLEEHEPAVLLDRLAIRDALLGEAAYLAAYEMNTRQAQTLCGMVEHMVGDGMRHEDVIACLNYLIDHSGNRILQQLWQRLDLHLIALRDPQTRNEMKAIRQGRAADRLDIDQAMGLIARHILNRDGDAARLVMHQFHGDMIQVYRVYYERHRTMGIMSDPLKASIMP